MTPLERLMAEDIPTRPPPAAPLPRCVPAGYRWTPAEQDAHWQALCEAVGALKEQRPRLRLAPAA
ncbi:hypothetical protein [Streptomyces caniscabiei]|uniref:hypothetical protein n=2 Tax=Streptomyces caniscabiei TaxID=2746961 RepID=UPI000765C7BC|nr:hypothetical protein [Streptomyces caniscabiei]